MRRGSGINKGTDPEQSAKREAGVGACEFRRGQQSANPGTGVQGVQGCPSRAGLWGVQEGSKRFWGKTAKNTGQGGFRRV